MPTADDPTRDLAEQLTPIQGLLNDEAVQEILINGPDQVFVERGGKLAIVPQRFPDHRALHNLVQALARFLGRRASTEKPILAGHLPNGARVEALLPPAATTGPILAIRRFALCSADLNSFLMPGEPGPAVALLLQRLLRERHNLLLCGATSSGKTSLLGCLVAEAARTDRVVVLEETRELHIPEGHVVPLQARPADARGRGRVSLQDLFRSALRLRPDRIVVGELRGPEAHDWLQAMNGGCGGSLTSVLAGHPQDALTRLETLVQSAAPGIPLFPLRQQIASAVDGIVQLVRCGTGQRRVNSIVAVRGYEADQGYDLAPYPLNQERNT